VAKAQSDAERIDRQLKAKDRLMAVTAADIQAAARRYLTDAAGVEITAMPQAIDASGGSLPGALGASLPLH
jgi:zinc protease